MSAPIFIGLDLAWGNRNPTGGAILHGGQLLDCTGLLGDNASILAWMAPWLAGGAPCIVAVDAPLHVRNPPRTRRRCDSELSHDFGRYLAAVHSVSCGTRGFEQGGRGEALVRSLAAFGFAFGPPQAVQTAGRNVVEVYPHAAHIRLFNLSERLPYKRKGGRSLAFIHCQIARYVDLLNSLSVARPALGGLDLWLPAELATLRGKSLKEFEDSLDAVTCAYIAAWLWHHGPRGVRVYGDPSADHIVVPVPAQLP